MVGDGIDWSPLEPPLSAHPCPGNVTHKVEWRHYKVPMMTETHLLGFVLHYESAAINMPKQVELNMGDWGNCLPSIGHIPYHTNMATFVMRKCSYYILWIHHHPSIPIEVDASYGWIMLLDIFRATDIPIFLFARSVQCV